MGPKGSIGGAVDRLPPGRLLKFDYHFFCSSFLVSSSFALSRRVAWAGNRRRKSRVAAASTEKIVGSFTASVGPTNAARSSRWRTRQLGEDGTHTICLPHIETKANRTAEVHGGFTSTQGILGVGRGGRRESR